MKKISEIIESHAEKLTKEVLNEMVKFDMEMKEIGAIFDGPMQNTVAHISRAEFSMSDSSTEEPEYKFTLVVALLSDESLEDEYLEKMLKNLSEEIKESQKANKKRKVIQLFPKQERG